MSVAQTHIDRLRTATLQRDAAVNLARWIERNTYIGGRPFSFNGRMYQKVIAEDQSQEINTQKPSQVGLSELMARMVLAQVNVITPFTAIVTMPTHGMGTNFMRTRVDTIINGAPVLKQALHKSLDNAEVKCFNGESFLYLKGAASGNAPISIPADMLVHDELDFSDPSIITAYQSRLTASKYRLVRRFSTPTLPDFGINKEMKQSRRRMNMVKCHHCNHTFYPSYYDHVHIPGYDRPLTEINKQTLGRIRWREAKLLCPKCGLEPSLLDAHREWVWENPSENLVAAGYFISPFDAPSFITPSYLIQASTNYSRTADFVNYSLGLVFDDKEATLTPEDFEGKFIHSDEPKGVRVMGIDCGGTYHVTIANVDAYGNLFVIHTEQVPQGLFRSRYFALKSAYRPACTVIDSQPHSETVMALQSMDPTLYASVYMRSRSMLTHTVIDREEDRDEGTEFVRQVNVNRSKALDAYMTHLRDGHIGYRDTENKDLIITQHTDMKRLREFDHESGEMSFAWKKNTGNDHFHHSGLYCYIASRIMGVSRGLVSLPFFTSATLGFHK